MKLKCSACKSARFKDLDRYIKCPCGRSRWFQIVKNEWEENLYFQDVIVCLTGIGLVIFIFYLATIGWV